MHNGPGLTQFMFPIPTEHLEQNGSVAERTAKLPDKSSLDPQIPWKSHTKHCVEMFPSRALSHHRFKGHCFGSLNKS